MLMIMVSSSLTSMLVSLGSRSTPSGRRSTPPSSNASSRGSTWSRRSSSWRPSDVSSTSQCVSGLMILVYPPSSPSCGVVARRSDRSPRRRCTLELHGNAAHAEVLAQRMTLPILRHQDPREIGVVVEPDTHEVEHLALHRLGSGPQLEQRREQRSTLGDLAPHPDALVPLGRKERDDDLEALP